VERGEKDKKRKEKQKLTPPPSPLPKGKEEGGSPKHWRPPRLLCRLPGCRTGLRQVEAARVKRDPLVRRLGPELNVMQSQVDPKDSILSAWVPGEHPSAERQTNRSRSVLAIWVPVA